MRKLVSLSCVGSLALLFVILFATHSYADLGLNTDDFGNKPVSGTKVTGKSISTGQNDSNNRSGGGEGFSEGMPGEEGLTSPGREQ